MLRLLIDECLSPQLAVEARRRGIDCSHVVWLKKSGWKDWDLKTLIIDGDWTFVTRNAVDFRGPTAAPGSKGQYADVALHAGLICLNGPVGMDYQGSAMLFDTALRELERDPDLLNQVLEITLVAEGMEILRYGMPA